MRIVLSLTPRLLAICTVCLVLIILLLVMLGFELGEHSARAELEAQYAARNDAGGKAREAPNEALSYSPVAAPSPTAVLYSATAPGKAP